MLQSFLAVFEQIFRILILMGVSFALNRLNLISEEGGGVFCLVSMMLISSICSILTAPLMYALAVG